MNYYNIYQKLMHNGQGRTKQIGLERHHIVPYSIGKSNKKENLVYLTTREHYLAHKLLVKIYQNEDKKKMVYALWWMSKTRHIPESGNIISSRDYATARALYIENHPNRDLVRKERYKQRRAAGLHKTNEHQHSDTVKKMLSQLTAEQLKERMLKSALSCDHEKRAEQIRRGKSSEFILEKLNGERTTFFSYDDVLQLTGYNYMHVKYRLNQYDGYLTNGERVICVRKYTGNDKNIGRTRSNSMATKPVS